MVWIDTDRNGWTMPVQKRYCWRSRAHKCWFFVMSMLVTLFIYYMYRAKTQPVRSIPQLTVPAQQRSRMWPLLLPCKMAANVKVSQLLVNKHYMLHEAQFYRNGIENTFLSWTSLSDNTKHQIFPTNNSELMLIWASIVHLYQSIFNLVSISCVQMWCKVLRPRVMGGLTQGW